jgi:twinkle protein
LGIYEFNREDVFRFASSVGAKTKTNGHELVFNKCPYCRPEKDKNTFSINLDTGMFECKRASCSVHGNMITLSRDFDFSLGRDADAYYKTVDYSRKQYRSFKTRHIETKDEAIEYMDSRGILPEIVRKYELTIHEKQEHVLVFPFRDENGELQFIKYRNLKFDKDKGGSKEWCEKNCKPILFGMNHCSGFDRLVITEGQIDSLSCAQARVENAVSVPTGKNGFTWIPYCWDWINKFQKIVVFGDCENGYITLAEELKKRWPMKVSVVRVEDYKGCKDANEILQEYGPEEVRFAVENAEPPNLDCIKPMARVEQVDIMKMERMSTGLESLDKILDGGFRFGQLAILTGKRGDGKSTIASMWGCEALNQNYNCFFYSGELPDFFFRNWMDRQITKKSEISQSDEDQLNQWYGEKAYIYDNTTVPDDNANLLKVIEVAIVQKNCRFVMVDNLMTALDPDLDNDLYRQQSKFVGELAKMAKKYNVFILLVAHPRKQYGNISNDDISGSSNITDRADIVLSYSKPTKDKNEEKVIDYDRSLNVMKNRLTGKLTQEEGIKLVFEPGSKRIAEHTKDFFSRTYNWTNDPYGFEPSDGDVPF